MTRSRPLVVTAMPDADTRPCLRPGLRAEPAGPGGVHLVDAFHISDAVLSLTPAAVQLAVLFDGTRTIADVHREATARGAAVTAGQLAEFAAALDRAGFLDGPTFREYLAGPVRNPSCVGVYPADPTAIGPALDRLFTAPGGPGLPGTRATTSPPGRLRAVMVPHMDYTRGGVTYGWGFRELVERTDARLFVIVATSHYSAARFGLTRMNFRTPLGTVETDQDYANRIVGEYGDGVFDDPFAHLPEHSVELEVVMLQHLLADRGPLRIVPLLVGSFDDCVQAGADPETRPDIARMVSALRNAEAGAGEPVCYIISGDLAHIGPKFGDPDPVADDRLVMSRTRDEAILAGLTGATADGLYRPIATEKDERRICGLPPGWLTLAVTKPRTGKVLHYKQYIHPQGHESVSFAAAAFYD